MKQGSPRVYVDTSVFGGVFDDEFRTPSERFFESVRRGAFRLVISDVVRRELAGSPALVQHLLDDMLPDVEIVPITLDALRLREAYVAAGILSARWRDDALHVAVATVSHCSMIVSWNFTHIVHFEKIPKYNALNTLKGYESISIYSPLEVVGYGDHDKDV